MWSHGEPVARAPEQLDQFVAHDLDDMLARRERREHVLPDGLCADALDEALDDLEVDVGLEQRHAHLTERFLDVLFRQAAEAAEPVEDPCQSRSEAVEHGLGLSRIQETLNYTDRRGKSQAYFNTSDALRKSLTAWAGSSVPNTAEPATRVVAPTWARSPAFSCPTPPSTEISMGRLPINVLIWRSFASEEGMKDGPPKPGFTDMTRMRSRLSRTHSMAPGGVDGLMATPALAPASLIWCRVRWRWGQASTWTVRRSAPARTKSSMY